MIYDSKKIGKKIYIERRRKKMSQQKMADVLGITRETLSSYEQGRNDIKIACLAKLCNEIGKTPNEILL